MTTILNASNGSTSGLIASGDNSGELQLQVNNGTPALTLNTTQALGVGSSPSYGTSGQILQSNGSGAAPSWVASPATNPAGSTGQVQYNNAGSFGAVSDGTSGQVLTSAGTGTVPTWTTPSAGAMTFISTLNVTNGAIQWTGLSGYTDYVIVLDSLKYSSFELVFVQFGTGAGPTWVTSGYMYITNFMATFSFGTWQGSSSTGESGVNISQKNADGTPVSPMIGQIYVSNMLSTTSTDSRGVTFQGGYSGGSGRYISLISTGFVTGISAAITGIRLLNSGGTFTGKVSLYGIKNT